MSEHYVHRSISERLRESENIAWNRGKDVRSLQAQVAALSAENERLRKALKSCARTLKAATQRAISALDPHS